MNDITLATHISKKLFKELFDESDPRRLHHHHDYFIAQILELLRKFPEIRQELSDDSLTVNNLIKTIESYFEKVIKKRKICTKTLRIVVKKNEKQRNKETFVLLLFAGFSMRFVVRRLMNNLKPIGELMDEEWDDKDIVKSTFDPRFPFSKQENSHSVEILYQLIENPDAPMSMIRTQIDKVAYEKQLILPNIENESIVGSNTEHSKPNQYCKKRSRRDL